jgi:RNA polymerase sigma factor (sigma-70 family)
VVTLWALIGPARLAGAGLLRSQSDARLVDLVRAGNDRAFEAIVLRYHRPLMCHCRRLLPASSAEDAVQQSFLFALEAMRADRRELHLGPWLHRIAHNTAIDALRRLDSQWEQLDERVDVVEPTHAAAEQRARFDSVVARVGSLPERQRRALVLRELEGRSYEEIASTLGVSGAGVRQLLNRARNAMRGAAGALVPTALVGRLAGSQAGRVAELADPPATSAVLAKATATAAAGAVALLAVGSTPGERPYAPRADAPRADTPRADTPRADTPRADTPRVKAGVRPRTVGKSRPNADQRRPSGATADEAATAHSRPAALDGPQQQIGEPGSAAEAGRRAPARNPADVGGAGERLLERNLPATAPRSGGEDDDAPGASASAYVPPATSEMEDDDTEVEDGADDAPVAGSSPPDQDDDDGVPQALVATQVVQASDATDDDDAGD